MTRTTRPALSLAFILTAAALAVWALGVTWIASVASQFSVSTAEYENIVVTRDGTALIHSSAREGNRYVERGYRTLDNKPVPDPVGGPVYSPFVLMPARDAITEAHRFKPLGWEKRIAGYSLGFNKPGMNREFWYFIHDGFLNGSGYLVGYAVDSKKVIGYWGTKGIAPQPPVPEDRFVVAGDYFDRQNRTSDRYHNPGREPWNSSADSFQLVLSDQVAEFDIARHRVTTLWQGEGIVDMSKLVRLSKSPSESIEPVHRLIVRTASRLHILGKDHKEEYSVEIPESMRNKVFDAWELAEGGLLVADLYSGQQKSATLAWIPKSGTANIVEVPLANPTRDPAHIPAMALVMPSPTVLAVAWAVVSQIDKTVADENWSNFWPTLLAMFVVSGALAVWVRRRHQQFGLGGENLWAAFVFLLGPLGAFAYFVHRPWPVCEPCPACRALAPRDRETCLHCGAEFPGPERLSTEIRA